MIDLRWTIREGAARHRQPDQHRRQRRDPRAGHPRGHRHAPGAGVQPRAADPQLPEHLATSGSSSSRCPRPTWRRPRTAWTWTSPSRGREAAPATSTSAPRWGRAPASAASSDSRSRTSSAGASAAGSSGSSAGTSTTSTSRYTDPTIQEIADLGHADAVQLAAALHRRRPRPPTAGGRLRPGRLPVLRLPLHPALHLVRPAAASATPAARSDLASRYSCDQCTRSTLGVQPRAGHPGRPPVRHRRQPGHHQPGVQRRRPGRHGNFQKLDSRASGTPRSAAWAATPQLGQRDPVRARAHRQGGFIFGDAGPFFTELYSHGRRAVRHSAARLRGVLHHAERVRSVRQLDPRPAPTPSASRTPPSPSRPAPG